MTSHSTTAPKVSLMAMRDLSSCESTSVSSSDSKLSMIARLKNQAHETGGFFKKQQHALAKKVQNGFKMVSRTAFQSQKRASVGGIQANTDAQAQAVGAESLATDAAPLDPSWISALEQMGFDRPQILESAAMLGGQPSQMDDLLQVLLVMGASSEGSNCEDHPPSGASAFTSCAMASSHDRSVAGSGAEPATPPPPLPPPLSPPPQLSPPFPALSAVGSAEFEMASGPLARSHGLDVATLEVLQGMGFTADTIQEALALLGPSAHFDDLFDVLLLMRPHQNGNQTASPNDAIVAAAALPASGQLVQEDSFAMASSLARERQESPDNESITLCQQAVQDLELKGLVSSDRALDEVPNVTDKETDDLEIKDMPEAATTAESAPLAPALAAAVVAMVIAKVSERESQPVDDAAPEKHAHGPVHASPVRGGA